MPRIAPKDLSEAIAAASPGDHLELDAGEHVGQVVIDKPLVIEGRGASTWLGNRTGPVLIVRCAGVELRDLQIEMTGDLQHPAILAEGNCEPVLRNVAIRRGELYVEGPLLRFAVPPTIRLRELEGEGEEEPAGSAAASASPSWRSGTSLSLAPPPPQPPPPAVVRPQPAGRTKRETATGTAPPPAKASAAPTTASSAAPTTASSASPSTAPPSASTTASITAPAPPRTSAATASSTVSTAATAAPTPSWRRARLVAPIAIAGLVILGLVLFTGGESKPRPAAQSPSDPSAPAAAAKASATASRSAAPEPAPSEPPPPAGLKLTSNLRTGVEVVGWSRDEERVLLEITYARDSSNPARWRVRAVVDAPSERVIQWQDVSDPPARVIAGEDEQPPWSADPQPIPAEDFLSGGVLEPAQLDVSWCGNRKSPRFPSSARPLGQRGELQLSWASSGGQLAPVQCRAGDFGQVLLRVKGSPWRLMRFLPWKGDTSTVRVHTSPSGRRAVVVAVFSLAGKTVTRFYSRLVGPQIHIVSSDPELRSKALRALGTPGLFMSENVRAPIPAPSRILVRAGDEEALRVARSLQEKLAGKLPLAAIEQVSISRPPPRFDVSYLWGDILIVLK